MKTIKNSFLQVLLITILSSNAFGQLKNSTTVDIIVNDIETMDKKITAFLQTNNLKVGKYNKSNYEIEIQINAGQKWYDSIVKEYRTWGYISSENTTVITHQPEIEKLREHIIQLQKEKSAYLSLAKYADSTSKGNYLGYIEKTIEMDKAIYQDEMKLKELESSSNYIQISLREEPNSTMKYSSSWVNMPGLEYSHLWIEQPEAGVTPSVMHGVSLKYLFNRGKSYGILGLYKSFEANTKFNQIYTFAFGQDFYSRRMGRGQRKFFNLYTSFNAGVYILTGEEQRSASWFINPFLGVEIFKNKYFLIDNKVGYFLPYRDNRNMRGLLYNFSFNFVF